MATATQAPSKLDLYRELARQLRADSIRCSTAAGSGHPTSSLSAADLMAGLLLRGLPHNWSKAQAPAKDPPLFNQGHAAPPHYCPLPAPRRALDRARLA